MCAALGVLAAALGVLAAPTVAQDAGIVPPTGRIAFIEDRTRIHVIGADGSDDQVVFETPPEAISGIQAVAWRPDGQRLAFASGHEEMCSVWVSDLYLMDPDGTALSRLTNGPTCAEQSALPTGTVRLTIDNPLVDVSQFTIHAQGLDEAVEAIVEPGTRSTFELTLRDLGPDTPQFLVVRSGGSTWFDAGVSADVIADGVADAGTLTTGNDPFDTWGALTASWSHDGTRIGYQMGLGSLWQIQASAGPLTIGSTLLDAEVNGAIAATWPVLSPVDDRVLYDRYDQGPSTIDLAQLDGDQEGETVMTATLVHGIDWLPDGSGFVTSDSSALLESANLMLVDLATGEMTQLTSYPDGFAMWPTVSPDGGWVAYSYSPVPLDEAQAMELRLLHLSSGQEVLLAANGLNPDWGP